MKGNGNGSAGGPPYLTYVGIKERYTFSEHTTRRLIKRGLWPEGRRVTALRVVFSQSECDSAFENLLANPIHTQAAEDRQREADRKVKKAAEVERKKKAAEAKRKKRRQAKRTSEART